MEEFLKYIKTYDYNKDYKDINKDIWFWIETVVTLNYIKWEYKNVVGMYWVLI